MIHRIRRKRSSRRCAARGMPTALDVAADEIPAEVRPKQRPYQVRPEISSALTRVLKTVYSELAGFAPGPSVSTPGLPSSW